MAGYYNNQNNNRYDVRHNGRGVNRDFNLHRDIREDAMFDVHRLNDSDDYVVSDKKSKITALVVMAIMAAVITGTVVTVIFKSVEDSKDKKNVETVAEHDKFDEMIEIEADGEPIADGEPLVGIKDAEIEGQNEDNGESSSETVEDKEKLGSSSEDSSQKTEKQDEQDKVSKVEEVKQQVQALSQSDARVVPLYQNFESYPLGLMKDIVRNHEMIDFAVGYLDGINKTYDENIDISGNATDTTYRIPLFIQWDSRWGYYKYGASTIGISGCGPTSLNMVYLALTGDTSYNPLKMAKFSTDNGYCVPGVGTSWSLMTEGAAKLGLKSVKVSNNESIMKESLQQGKYIIASMGPGIFTEQGHFIVFSGYESGKFYVNDPFCIEHSKRTWSYSEFGSQIKALWVLERAM